ncbi:MAG: tetratricopeptide repeat protein [Cyanobacteria bacterium]|nr:tetratricopeptide repeat protein [Cyanobacteriota bacterium]
MTQHTERASVLMHQQDYPQAIQEYQIALRLSPHAGISASLFNNLGICFRKVGQYPQAMSSFQHAFRIQPGFEFYYRNLIETYREAHVLGVAQAQLKEVLKINPRDAEALFLLGLLYEEIEDYEGAKEAFIKFLTLEPNSQLAVAARTHL